MVCGAVVGVCLAVVCGAVVGLGGVCLAVVRCCVELCCVVWATQFDEQPFAETFGNKIDLGSGN